MQVEQTERLADVVASALECVTNERAQFLSDVCGEDVALRLEAESFLRFEKSIGDFLEIPAWEMARPLEEESPPPFAIEPVTEEPTFETSIPPEPPNEGAAIESSMVTTDFASQQAEIVSAPASEQGFFEVPPLDIREGEIPVVTEWRSEAIETIETPLVSDEISAPVSDEEAEMQTEPEIPMVRSPEATEVAQGFSEPAGIQPASEAIFEEPAATQQMEPVEEVAPNESELLAPTPPPAFDTPDAEPLVSAAIAPDEPEKIEMPAEPSAVRHETPLPPAYFEREARREFPPPVSSSEEAVRSRFGLYDAGRILALVLLIATIAVLIMAREKAEALRYQRDLAQAERIQAERLTGFLRDTFALSNENLTSVWPVPQRKPMTVAEMLDQIAPRLEKEFRNRPDIHAGMLRMLGSAYASQGKYDAAERNLRAAFGAQVRLYGEENGETAATMVELGILCVRESKPEEAERFLQRAVDFYRKQRESQPNSSDPARFALALAHLGETRFQQGDTATGVNELREALEIAKAANLKPQEQSVLPFCKGELGGAFVLLGETEQGEPLLREALDDYGHLANGPHWEAGEFQTLLGVAALNRDQPNEAQNYLEEGRQILGRTLGDRNLYVVRNLDYEASALAMRGDFKAAETKARECVALSRAVSPRNRLPWAQPLRTLGNILTLAGEAKEGEDNYREALAICERQSTRNFSLIVPMKIQLCHLLLAQKRLTEAENLAFEAQNEAQQHFDEQDPVRKAAASNLIQIYRKQGKDDVAQTVR